MTSTEITRAIEGQIDTLTAIYADAFRAAYDRITAWHAAHPRQSPYNDRWAVGDARMAGMVTKHRDSRPGAENRYLCEDALARHSREQAELIAARYAAKVEAKAEGVTDVTVSRMDASGSFVITGTKAGRAVEIRQSIVTKCSPKGTWFVQFPALVYIDGKKSTEKALKAL